MEKILVANRGEIALRVMRSAKEMGIKTVAIYSEVDRLAPHVRYANEAVCIGPAPSKDSYLRIDKILKICKDLKVDGIHPGYGFLSENAAFSDKVKESGFVFIGPDGDTIRQMGDKIEAKRAMQAANIPCVPGNGDPLTAHAETNLKMAREIGYPVIIKAAGGGGGRGMRTVHTEASLLNAILLTKTEAGTVFGNDTVYMEKFLEDPRHIYPSFLLIQAVSNAFKSCSI